LLFKEIAWFQRSAHYAAVNVTDNSVDVLRNSIALRAGKLAMTAGYQIAFTLWRCYATKRCACAHV